MKPAQRFEELIVWQKAHKLVLEIYKLTLTFPKFEIYGLTSQIRHASVSILLKAPLKKLDTILVNDLGYAYTKKT